MTSLAAWKAAGAGFEFKGRRIFCREGGSRAAPALLLIHGFPSASWDYAPMWEALAARYRVLTLDMLGFGFSDKPARHDYSIHEQADLFEALLQRHGVGEVHLLAHDYGVSVAQELLARHCEGSGAARLASVVFLNGGLFPETHNRLVSQSLLLSPLGPLMSRLMSKQTLSANLRRVFGPKVPPSPEFLDGTWDMLAFQGGARILHRLIHYIPDRIRHRERWVAALQGRAAPIRLIDGVSDPVSGGPMVRRYRELVPEPDVIELDGIGHYPQVQAPEAVLAATFAFHAGLQP